MSGLPSAKILTGLNKMEWKKPRDGESFLGYLIGGRKETREEIGKTLRQWYGIKIWKSFGDEMRKTPGGIFIDPRAEVVVFLADDLSDIVIDKVMKCCRAGGQTLVGINRKSRHTWDRDFAAHGFNNPPGWILIPNIADPDRLESQRLAEQAALDAMEKPRPAYVEEARVTIGDKLKLVEKKPEDIINQYVPGKNKTPTVVPTPPRTTPSKRGTLKPGERSPNAGSTPLGAALIKAREALGFTQGEAARQMSISQGNLSSYERGHTIPLYASWLRMRELLGDAIPKPEGMLGQKSYEARGGDAGATPRGKEITTKLTAKEAFGGKPAPALTPAPAPAPVAARVADAAPQPPVLPVAQAEVPAPAPAPTASAGEERVTVKLKSGGTITLSTSVSLLKLKGPDRKFVFEMIDALQAYEEEKKE